MRKTFLLSMLFLFGSLLASATVAQESPATTLHTLEHDALERSYHLFLPTDAPQGLIVALHPLASSGLGMQTVTGLNEVGTAQNWAVVYPNAVGFYWDDGRSEVDLPPAEGAVDDLGFLAALLDDLLAAHDIDPAQVFLTGLGNGGTMAFAAACQMPERFAGVAVVGALMWGYQQRQCEDTEAATAVNMLILHGAQDPTYFPQGREIRGSDGLRWDILSAEATQQFWAQRNGCDLEATEQFAQTSLLRYSECSEGTQTAFVSVVGGGNNWPRINESPLNRFGVDANAILSAFFRGEQDWQTLTVQEDIPEERPRSYVLYVPTTYDPSTSTPLVLLLHGRTVNAATQAYTSNMNAIAEREGFIALYPDGLDNQWNYGLGIPEYGTPVPDDDRFLNTLLDDLQQELNIDEQRLYVTGLSNGGLMTQRLACLEADRFAAFASVAATAPFGLTQWCEGTAPVPMLFIQGTADGIMPWDGVQMAHPISGEPFYVTAPMDNTMAFWALHNECDTEFEQTPVENNDEGSMAVIFDFVGCPDDAPLRLFGVIGGGHVWPGVRDFESDVLGEVNMDFNASEVIWDFFQQHTLDE